MGIVRWSMISEQGPWSIGLTASLLGFGFGGVDKTWQSIHHLSVRHIRYRSWELDWGGRLDSRAKRKRLFSLLGGLETKLFHSFSSLILRLDCFVLEGWWR
jgi:hypothetical protein